MNKIIHNSSYRLTEIIIESIRDIYRFLRNIFIRLFARFNGKILEDLDNVLIIAPHPDDEVLGCGGLISYMNQQKKNIDIIFLTKGENVESYIPQNIIKEERTKLAIRASKCANQPLDHVFLLDFTDGDVNINSIETEKLKSIIAQIKPKNIFVTSLFDSHKDHIQSNNIIREINIDKHIKIFEYCVWFWHSMSIRNFFSINWKNVRFFKMGKDLIKLKKKLIKIYTDETDSEGEHYSGDLPGILITNCSRKNELYFETSVKRF